MSKEKIKKLMDRIEREYRRLQRHQLEIENNKEQIRKAIEELKVKYNIDYLQ